MKLHLGCGKKHWPGYINIDGAPANGKQPDVLHDFRYPLPYDANVVSEIQAIHLFEHFYPHEAAGILSDWRRVLKPGGRLVLEMPDIYKSAKNLIREIDAGKTPSDTWSMWPIFGANPKGQHYDDHKTGWTFKTLKPLLETIGFQHVIEKPTQHHGKRQERDFRVEAVKL